jgi:hypothetical protein
MSEAFKDWEKDGQGRLKVWPLAAFETAVFNNERGGLRLEIDVPAKPGQPIPAVQLALDPEQLRNLAEALVEVATRLDQTKAPGGNA